MSEDGFSDSYDEPSMDLFVETLTGATFEMRVYPSDTIWDIKHKIHRVEGIPVYHQNLLYQFKELEDGKRLCDIGISSGATLKLVLSMRGGPISTRRLSSCDHHIVWKDLKELIEHTKEEMGDKLGPNSKVSVLVFKDGDVINLIRVIENDDGSYFPYNEKPLPMKDKIAGKDNCHISVFDKLMEDNEMLTKLSALRQKMQDVSLKRQLRNSKPIETNEESTDDEIGAHGYIGKRSESLCDTIKPNDLISYKLMAENSNSNNKSEVSLRNRLKLLENYNNSLEVSDNLQIGDDSAVALKEKHRNRIGKIQKPLLKSDDNSFGAKSRNDEARRSYLDDLEPFRRESMKFSQAKSFKSLELDETHATKVREKREQDKFLNSSFLTPLYKRYSPDLPKRKSSSIIPDLHCDLELSSPSTSSSIAESIAILEEEAENENKEVLSPIGVPCAGTLSMSNMPARNRVHLSPLLLPDSTDSPRNSPNNLDENTQDICDMIIREPGKHIKSSTSCKVGILKHQHSFDFSTNRHGDKKHEESDNRNFEMFGKNFYEVAAAPQFVSSPSAIPSQYVPKEDRMGDLYFGNRVNDKLRRRPLYRRRSHVFSSNKALCSRTDNGKDMLRSSRHLIPNSEELTANLQDLSNGTRKYSSTSGIQRLQNDYKTETEENEELFGRHNLGYFDESENYHQKTKSSVHLIRCFSSTENETRSLKGGYQNLHKIKRLDYGDVNSCVDATKLDSLPAVVPKKKMRCGQCNKRLNITTIYDCRCGGIFCAQHRYSEVHGCKYDYKTEGRKLLQQQNPLVIAEKLSKI